MAGQMSFDLPKNASAMTREDFILDGAKPKGFDMIVSLADWPSDVDCSGWPGRVRKSHLPAIQQPPNLRNTKFEQ